MKIAVVKYNAGNIYSVNYALKRLGVEATITSDKELLLSADKVIFHGVGEAETTMIHLRKSRLDEVIKNLKQPVLGLSLIHISSTPRVSINVLHKFSANFCFVSRSLPGNIVTAMCGIVFCFYL